MSSLNKLNSAIKFRYSFSLREYDSKFSNKQYRSVLHFKFVLYVNSNTPETILSVNFGLFGENFVTSFI